MGKRAKDSRMGDWVTTRVEEKETAVRVGTEVGTEVEGASANRKSLQTCLRSWETAGV